METKSFQSFTERKNFFSFLQFLVYTQNLGFTRDYLGFTSYRWVVFRVQDFLKYQKPTVKFTNYYQLKKLIDFFDELQGNSLIKSFTDNAYRSLVTIPEIKLEKSKHNSWIAKVWIVEELFHYSRPFFLPNFFKQQTIKDEFEIQFKVIQVFSSVNIEKIFFVEDFFQDYSSTISDQQKTKMKKSFIRLIKILEEYDLINSNYKIISNGMFYDTEKLTTNNILEGFIVYEKLSI